MPIIPPTLVAGMTIAVRDERDNPMGRLAVVAADTLALTLGCGTVHATVGPDAILTHDRAGLALIASALGPELLAAIAASQP